jgi:hypothetical protein
MAASDLLPALNYQRELLAQQGMGLLGAWALLNLLVSGWLVVRTSRRSEAHYFHQMNALWNVVNALLAVWGIVQAHPLRVEGMTVASSLADQQHFEGILLFNAGLDVAYVVTGFWLRSRAATAEALPERLLGFGRSLWVQGGFLFLFDLGLYTAYHRFMEPLLNMIGR